MRITKRQLRQIIKEEFRSREGKRLTRARYDELTSELDELYARIEDAKGLPEPKRTAYLQFYQNAINSLQGHLARVRAEGLSEVNEDSNPGDYYARKDREARALSGQVSAMRKKLRGLRRGSPEHRKATKELRELEQRLELARYVGD